MASREVNRTEEHQTQGNEINGTVRHGITGDATIAINLEREATFQHCASLTDNIRIIQGE